MGTKHKVSNLESEAYLERLKDWGTYNFYECNPPILSDVSVKLPVSGHFMWQSIADPDPWELLAAAVIRQAVDDYISAWRLYKRCAHPMYFFTMQQLEEGFFKQNGSTEYIFKKLKEKLDKH